MTIYNDPLIDIGANLAHESFKRDFDQVLARADEAGVKRMVITGSDQASNQKAYQWALQHPKILYATAGLHPHYAEQYGPELKAQIDQLVAQPQVVAVGEMGLDFYRDLSPRATQEQVFEAQLDLAVKHQKPAFLHQREAHSRFLPILKHYRDHLKQAVVHCFTDNKKALYDYLDMDLYIGITGWVCDDRRGGDLQKMVTQIPDHRLMIETDAPYLLPKNITPTPKSRRNEPCYLPQVLAKLSLLRQQNYSQLAQLTHDNAMTFFQLDQG